MNRPGFTLLEICVKFPREESGINSLREVVERFVESVDKATQNWGQMLGFAPQDCAIIRQASESSNSFTILFSQLTGNGECDAQHQAKLNLSGPTLNPLRVMIRGCQEATGDRWLPAVLEYSRKQPQSDILPLGSICSSTESPEALTNFFDSNMMWTIRDDNGSSSSTIPPAERCLQDYLDARRSGGPELDLNCRSLAECLLAAAFFQLSGSPWMNQPLEAECISLCPPDDRWLEQWRPHALRTLAPNTVVGNLGDSVAALAVLVLELETERKASWTETDKDFDTGERSHAKRLGRLLGEWGGKITDDDRKMAHACLEFNCRVRNLADKCVPEDVKTPAAIYKWILQPIVKRSAGRFRQIEQLFTEILAPRAHIPSSRNISSDNSGDLFDGEDSPFDNALLKASKDFFATAKGFLEYTEQQRGDHCVCPRKKIALLDTGVDLGHVEVSCAVDDGRVNKEESKSFITSAWNEDADKHGTIVASLALRAAPTAEIVIGKVCETRKDGAIALPVLANGINWATDEIKADVICLASGYRESNEAVEKAVANAVKKGVLVIAAASNSGALDGRARPACLNGVVCMHAAEGYGRPGAMNPPKVASDNNFSTLGVGVDVLWKGEEMLKSGTSFATPIAAGFAACMLEFVDTNVTGLSSFALENWKTKRGMQAIFEMMSLEVPEKDGYQFINPKYLCKWEDPNEVRTAVGRVKKRIQEL
ncbi:unnamed protein product [Clonostachys rosea]|uniref:Peptidase S8/S53 domain-containing protein n=1 Tax=Bionectria ochroleuca TaxID=29856 RepID=A0ABY6U862_BIOOC|nr:unnamed protein product [Clonostachys rosea]